MPRSEFDPVELVKRAAVEAVAAMKPVELCFGEVVSASPLKIKIDQNDPLQGVQLILSRNVTDFTIDVSMSGMTGYTNGGSGDDAFASHAHSFSGTKKALFHNALVVGDQVVLFRLQGGKKFLVWDRIKPNPSNKGEWV